MYRDSALVAVMILVTLAAACTSSGSGGREVKITQRDDGCTPTSIPVTAGEKLKLVVKNESKKDYEIEGIDGTSLQEMIVPEGRTRTPGYTVPSGAGIHKIKCYVPAGVSTVIELVATDPASAASGASASATAANSPVADATAGTSSQSGTSVAITLVEYSVTADKPSVTAGKIRFIATNVSSGSVHELYVLKPKQDGTFDKLGEIPAIAPGAGGSIELDLTPGTYQLACLIIPGEAGSTVDHYQQGMHTPFTVK